MNRLYPLIYLPLLLLTQSLFGQTPFQPLSKAEAAAEKRNHNCAKNTNHSPEERRKNYPFNVSPGIQLVSFDGLVRITDSKEFIYVSSDPPLLADGVDTIPYTPAREVKSLSSAQIDQLTDILYNYGFAGPILSQKTLECYSPRNAILFRDENGKALAFIEICFECRNTSESSDIISLGQMCDQKLDMIKKLFREAGIKYGIK
jgi:hypothetical protein